MLLTIVVVVGVGAEVVVYGLREADDRDAVFLVHLLGRAVGVVTADGHQNVDLVAFDIAENLLGTILGALLAREGVGAGGEQRGATVEAVVGDIGQIDDVAVAEQALPATQHAIDAEAEHGGTVANRLDAGIDGRGVAAAGKNRQGFAVEEFFFSHNYLFLLKIHCLNRTRKDRKLFNRFVSFVKITVHRRSCRRTMTMEETGLPSETVAGAHSEPLITATTFA